MQKNKNVRREKLKKGEHNYINYKKKYSLVKAFVFLLIGLLIFVIGLFLNKFEVRNIFSVIAITMIIPIANSVVNYIVFFRFRSVEKELYECIIALKKENDIFYTDVVFTSPEKIMFLAFLAVAGNEVIGFLDDKKGDAKYIKNYLQDNIKKRGLAYKVTIDTTKEGFVKRYLSADRQIVRSEENEENLTSYLYSLMVL